MALTCMDLLECVINAVQCNAVVHRAVQGLMATDYSANDAKHYALQVLGRPVVTVIQSYM
jgi:hypothetical protein